MREICNCHEDIGLACSDCPNPSKGGKCQCFLCEGRYIQVDPVDCGCTECLIGEYRPARNQRDYDFHNITNQP